MSNKKTTQKINEKDLVLAADNAIKVEEFEASQIIPGEPLPGDVENPDLGVIGHRCIDIEGNYQPTWTCLNIHRVNDSVPSRQYFACGDRSWRVLTGQWVDVPPEIITTLSHTHMEEIEMDITKANPLANEGVVKTIRKIPRFSTSMIPSS